MKLIIRKLIENAKNVNILVIGDFMIDEFLSGKVERINPEAPVPILNVKKQKFILGGAGNVVRNVLSLGANVYVSTVIGDDEDVNIMKSLINKSGIPTDGIIEEKNRKTSRKTRLLSSHQHLFRYDNESTHNISAESEAKIIEYIKSIIDKVNVIILEDYGKGVLTERLLRSVITLCKENNKIILTDPNKINWTPYSNSNVITPNKKEAERTLGYKLGTEEELEKGGFELAEKYSIPYILITKGDEGMTLFIRDEKKKIDIAPREVDVYDSAGAGDTVIASYAVALSSGFSYIESAEFSNIAGAIVVSKSGVATVSAIEVVKYLQDEDKLYLIDKKLKNNEDIKTIVDNLKKSRQKIVFTNGCFDLIHKGHIRYLEQAANLGDVLIVGVNDDESVKRLKGEKRPINNIDDRTEILAAFSFIDYIIVFKEDTPYNLINMIKPDILVKGGDYKPENIVGAGIVTENGGQVIVLPYIEGSSSSNIIRRIETTNTTKDEN